MKFRKKVSIVVFLSLLLALLGMTVVAQDYDEAPMLKEKVNEGNLPELEKRLPEEPCVIEEDLIKSTGKYGGTLQKGTQTLQTPNYMYFEQSGVAGGPAANYRAQLAERVYDPNKYGEIFIPRLAKDWEFSNNHKTFTLYLRKGVKWSDGEPFTAEDIKFSYEDIILNENLPYESDPWIINDNPIELKVINDYTVEFNFDEPMPLFPKYLDYDTPALALYPKHKLKEYHPDYNSDATYEDLMNARPGSPDFTPVTLGPWIVKEYQAGSNMVLERNPYYWAVDSEGNQLPYINEVIWKQYPERNSHVLAFMGGEVDLLEYNEGSNEYFSTMMQREENRPFEVWLTPQREGPCIFFNFDIEDSNLNEVFNNLKFRKALSYGINREAIVRAFAPGRAEPHLRSFSPLNPYHDEENVPDPVFDQEKANQMLDELGLEDVNNDGFREFSDGSEMSIILRTFPSRMDLFEMVKNYWEDIGIQLSLESTREERFYDIWMNGDYQLIGDNGWGWSTVPLQHQNWWVATGESGEPTTWHIVNNDWEVAQKANDLFDEALTKADFQERKELMSKAEKLIAENYQGIGLYATQRPQGKSEKLKNVPKVNNRRLTYMYTYAYAYYINE